MTRFAVCLGLVALTITGCTKTAPKDKPEEKMEPAARVTADDMLTEYRKNAVAGDAKFKDKLIEVSGTVAGVGKAPLRGYFVGFGAAVEGVDQYDIMCFLDETAKDDAAKLSKGDKVKLMGLCEGQVGGLMITLKRCVVVK